MYKGLNALGQHEHAGYHSHDDHEEMIGGMEPLYHGEDGVSDAYDETKQEDDDVSGYKAMKKEKHHGKKEESEFDKLVEKEAQKDEKNNDSNETKKPKTDEHLPPQFRNIEIPNKNAPSKKDLIKKELEEAIQGEMIERR